jgi:hypothetical protein
VEPRRRLPDPSATLPTGAPAIGGGLAGLLGDRLPAGVEGLAGLLGD